MDNNAMYKISYGLFVITANEKEFDNGCIINTVTQVTSEPNRISVAINKLNKTHDMVLKSGRFNVSVLTESSPFDYYKRFGFQSGRDVNKFDGFNDAKRSDNGIFYITKHTNAYISATVKSAIDLGTHTLFIANVKDAEILSNEISVTYEYYLKSIKLKENSKRTGTSKAYRCTVCGYIFGGELPDDFICPVCKHGAKDFERIS